MDVSTVASYVSTALEEGDVIVEEQVYDETEAAWDLRDASVLESDELETEVYVLDLFDDGVEVGDLVLQYFPCVNMAYLSDFELVPSYRTRGIGRNVYSNLLDALEEEQVDCMYIVPVSDPMEHIVKTEGGVQVEFNSDDSWYVHSL